MKHKLDKSCLSYKHKILRKIVTNAFQMYNTIRSVIGAIDVLENLKGYTGVLQD